MNSIHKHKPQRTCVRVEGNYKNYKEDLRNDFYKRCGYCDDLDYYYGGRRIYHIDHFKPHSIARGFIDPCDDEYDEHLKRENDGKITYKTSPQGEFIWKNIKLYLRRHELLWMLDKVETQKEKLNELIDSLGKGHHNIDEYINLYRSELD